MAAKKYDEQEFLKNGYLGKFNFPENYAVFL